jgi:hypothetical protein
MQTKLWSKYLKGRGHSKDLGVDLREIELEAVDWIQLAQVTIQWRALVSILTNFLIPPKAGVFLTS